MPKYKILVNGRNFLVNYNGEPKKFKFYATRFVETIDPDAAENLVMDILRDQLKALVLNDRSDSPMMYLDEIQVLNSFEGCLVPGEGFIWYGQGDDS